MSRLNQFEKSREILANERTFLAWIRTSIALMGFGFVIVKFSLFIQQLALLLGPENLPAQEYSGVVGIVMISIGVLIVLFAFLQYKKYEKQLSNSSLYSSSKLYLFITFMLILGGIVLLIYMLSLV